MLGKLETKVMKVIWSSEKPLTPRQVLELLAGDLAYTTVMTIMSRLYDKGMLTRQKQGRGYCYEAKKDQQGFAKASLGQLFSDVFDSYGDLAVSNFISESKKKPELYQKLKALLDDEDKQPQS